MKGVVLSLFLAGFLVGGCAAQQPQPVTNNEDPYLFFRERLYEIDLYCPITDLHWGEDYDTVIDVLYKNRAEIEERNKEAGKIMYTKESSMYHLFFRDDKLYQSNQVFIVPNNISHHEIYYDFHQEISKVWGKPETGHYEREGFENAGLISKWQPDITNISLLLDIDERVVILRYTHQGDL